MASVCTAGNHAQIQRIARCDPQTCAPRARRESRCNSLRPECIPRHQKFSSVDRHPAFQPKPACATGRRRNNEKFCIWRAADLHQSAYCSTRSNVSTSTASVQSQTRLRARVRQVPQPASPILESCTATCVVCKRRRAEAGRAPLHRARRFQNLLPLSTRTGRRKRPSPPRPPAPPFTLHRVFRLRLAAHHL